MTTPDEAPQLRREHTWEGDATQVFHCTTCGLVTTSTDTYFTCRPRPTISQRRGSEGTR